MGAAPKIDYDNTPYFVRIKSQTDKEAIVEALVASNNPLLIKAADNVSIHALAKAINIENMIVCQYHMLSPTLTENPAVSAQSYIVNFSVKNEEYFFQSQVTPVHDGFLISYPNDVYHLQRRRAIRLKLPLQMGARVKILHLNQRPHFCEGLILDFSVGGLRITLKAFDSKVKLHDVLMLSINLGKRIPFSLDAVVRFSEINGDYQTCGLEFLNKTPTIEQKLHTLQLDMQSEIFRKWNHQDKK